MKALFFEINHFLTMGLNNLKQVLLSVKISTHIFEITHNFDPSFSAVVHELQDRYKGSKVFIIFH